MILAVVVHAASIQDRDGGLKVLMRMIGRFGRYRRLSRDYETLHESSESMVHLA